MSEQNIASLAGKSAPGGNNPNAVGPRAGTAPAKPPSILMIGTPGAGTTTTATLICMLEKRGGGRSLLAPRGAAAGRAEKGDGALSGDVEGAIEAIVEGGVVADLDLDAGRALLTLAGRVKLSRYLPSGLQAVIVAGPSARSAQQARDALADLRRDAADAGVDRIGIVRCDNVGTVRGWQNAEHIALAEAARDAKLPVASVECADLSLAEKVGFEVLFDSDPKELAERLKAKVLATEMAQARFRAWVTRTAAELKRLAAVGLPAAA